MEMEEVLEVGEGEKSILEGKHVLQLYNKAIPASSPYRTNLHSVLFDENKSKLMTIPPEMRLEIFRHLLTTTFYILLTPRPVCRCLGRMEQRREQKPLFVHVLLVNRQIHDEAIGVLYGENQFMFALMNHVQMNIKLPTYYGLIRHGSVNIYELAMYRPTFPRGVTCLTLFIRFTPQKDAYNAYFRPGSEEREKILARVKWLKERGLQKLLFDETYQPMDMFKGPIMEAMAYKDSKVRTLDMFWPRR